MKAVVIHEARDLRVDTLDIEPISRTGVAVKIASGGICGSDLHYYNHGGFGPVRLREPMVLGHEVSGVVEDVGADVRGLNAGDLVAVSPSRPCGVCKYCQQGLQNHCLNMRFYGSAMPFPHIQGAFRETLVADQAQCVALHNATSGEAAMAEPLSVCLHATHRAGDLVGKRVLVTGCGPIGLLSILCARRAGAAEIIATDIAAFPLSLAAQCGADAVHDVRQDPEALAPYAADKGTFDVLYECSGAEVALVAAIPALRPRGIIMQLGLGGDMRLPMMQITGKELDLRGSFRFHEEFATAVTYIEKGLVDVRPLITDQFAIDDAVVAFEAANDRSKSMKVQITFG